MSEITELQIWTNFSSDLDQVPSFGPVSARLDAKLQFRKDFLTTMSFFLVGVSRSGGASQSLHNDCPELEICFSRAERDSRPGEAGLVVQGAAPDLELRD